MMTTWIIYLNGFLFVNKHKVRQWLRKWWTWWSQKCLPRVQLHVESATGGDYNDLEKQDANLNFQTIRYVNTVKESES